jgi:hypothetical protein
MKFLSEIFSLQAKTGASVFCTSRFIPEIMREFETVACPSLEIRATKEDVQTYLDAHIPQLPPFVRHNTQLQDEIKTEIGKVVDGM